MQSSRVRGAKIYPIALPLLLSLHSHLSSHSSKPSLAAAHARYSSLPINQLAVPSQLIANPSAAKKPEAPKTPSLKRKRDDPEESEPEQSLSTSCSLLAK